MYPRDFRAAIGIEPIDYSAEVVVFIGVLKFLGEIHASIPLKDRRNNISVL